MLKVAALKGNNHYLLSKGIDPVLVSRRLRTTSIKRKRKKAKIRAAIFLYFFFLLSSKTFRYGEKTDNCEKEEKHLRNLEYRNFAGASIMFIEKNHYHHDEGQGIEWS